MFITPTEALFALYKVGFENDSTVVYGMPTPIGDVAGDSSAFKTVSADPTCPVEVIIVKKIDGVPTLINVVESIEDILNL